MTKPSARRSAQTHTRAEARQVAQQQARTRRAKAAFLAAFRKRGIVLRASIAAKVGRRTVYDWLQQDSSFKQAYDDALEDAIDLVEEEAIRRAVDGVRKPVYQAGSLVGHVQEYSDSLTIAVLKGRRADVYNRERHEHSGPNGGPIRTAPDEAIDARIAELERQLKR